MASDQRPSPHTMLSDSDAGMLQYLINRYGADELIAELDSRMCMDTGSSPSSNETTTPANHQHLSVDSPSPYNGTISRDLSPRTSLSSVHSSFSSLSHITTSSATSVSDVGSLSIRSSMHSDVSIPDSSSIIAQCGSQYGHPGSSQKGSLQARAVTNALHHSNALQAAQKKTQHACPFCAEYNIPLTCGRKSDLKKHFIGFHNQNAQWRCPSNDCGMVFDWKSAFESHVKKTHGNLSAQADHFMVRTCPQVVFACGFMDCKFMLEADGDVTAEKTAHKYFDHIAGHFDDHGSGSASEWSYSVRFRNLMRQPIVHSAWKNRTKVYQQKYGWHPQTSATLRKNLETRHVNDAQQLVQYAAALETIELREKAHFPAELFVPILDQCPGAVNYHSVDREGEWPLRGERFASPAMSHPSTRPVTPAQYNNQPLIPVATLESQAYLMPSPSRSTVNSPAESTVMGIEFPQPPQIRYYSPSADSSTVPLPSIEESSPSDTSFATRAAQHPLALFTGYSSTRASQLPQGATVIADLAKRIEERTPMTAADLAALNLQQDIRQPHRQQHHMSPYGNDNGMDVDMTGYPNGPFFM